MPFISKILKKTTGLITREQNNILKTSFAMMFIIAITKAVGFLYTALIARQLGASRESDLFLLANSFPELLGNFILVGLIGAALIPVLIKAEKVSHARFLKLFNSLLNFLLIIFIIVAIIVAIFSNEIFPFILEKVINPQFEFTPEDIQRSASMMRILLIPQIILGISAFYSSGLNVFQQFLVPQLAPLFYNLGRIVGALFFIPIFGGVEGLVWGTMLGALLHLAIQVPFGRRVGIRHKTTLDVEDEYFVESMRVGIPRMLGIGAEYFAITIDRFIAARFIAGSVTAFDFGLRLISIPIALFGLTFSIAALPPLSKMYQSGEMKKFSGLFVKLINQVFFLSIPVTAALLILRVPFVRLFYGIFGGAFDLQSTYLTAWILAFLAVGLVFESVRSLVYRGFYAAGDTVHTLYAALFTMVAGIVTGILFTNYFSHFDTFDFNSLTWNVEYFFSSSDGRAAVGGLALSSSIVFTIEFFLLIFMFNKKVVKLDKIDFTYKILKKILAGVIMGMSMFIIFKFWGDTVFQTKTIYLILLVGGTLAVGLGVYTLSCYLLKVDEYKLILAFIQKLKLTDIKKTFSRSQPTVLTPVE